MAENCEKNCKICVHGRYCRNSGSVYCATKKRMLLSNKAETCEDYGDNYDIRRLKKRG